MVRSGGCGSGKVHLRGRVAWFVQARGSGPAQAKPEDEKKANHKVPGHGFVRTFTGGEVLGGECCGKRVQEIVIMLWNPGKEQS